MNPWKQKPTYHTNWPLLWSQDHWIFVTKLHYELNSNYCHQNWLYLFQFIPAHVAMILTIFIPASRLCNVGFVGFQCLALGSFLAWRSAMISTIRASLTVLHMLIPLFTVCVCTNPSLFWPPLTTSTTKIFYLVWPKSQFYPSSSSPHLPYFPHKTSHPPFPPPSLQPHLI